jgi:hypothetical protein
MAAPTPKSRSKSKRPRRLPSTPCSASSIRPSTPAEWSAYRATLSCQIGIEVMQGDRNPPEGVTPEQWGLYNLLHAVKSLAEIHLPNT